MQLTPHNHTCCECHNSESNITPTPQSHQTSLPSTTTTPSSSQSTSQIVYIVTDTCYSTPADFSGNKGTFRIDSVHSNKKNANARAKKIIYDTGLCKVDVDKIIQEMKRGLFAGIGVGGKVDGMEGSCYARKTQVERKMVDEDSEDEEGTGEEGEEVMDEAGSGVVQVARSIEGDAGADADVEMG
ncbi:hypothetical protein EK21DRAFT_87359 [Setomelanomma holmii]|uniref:Uncharacterized protein n=1 Tax=Setomelanomma holmii TaxID=210430 RepID=A0A9P4LQX9_9PLEO|nr:hypothetical protein EK21DRAFT_87359 [Setomelanomma holmii]